LVAPTGGGAEKLTFWARGKEADEKIDFGVGLLGSHKPYPDTVNAKLEGVTLKREWKRYTIKLKGKGLTRVKSAFFWTLAVSNLGDGAGLQR
jgi:hypothetical protein